MKSQVSEVKTLQAEVMELRRLTEQLIAHNANERTPKQVAQLAAAK